MIETNVYKLAAGAYMRELFSCYLRRKWYLFVLVACPWFLLSFLNLNFIYVGIIAIFIIIPMLLGFVYYFYAFSEECIASIRKGKIWIDENIIKRIYLDDDGETIGEKAYSWDLADRCVVASRSFRFYFCGKKDVFLLVPSSVFESESQRENFIALLKSILRDRLIM